MIYMPEKVNLRTVSMRLPESVIADFNRVKKMFGVKERTMAAAVSMYCQASKDVQWEWYQKMEKLYETDDDEINSQDIDRGKAVSDGIQKALKRQRSARDQG